MRVYLAGKIAKNDWRHEIFPSLRHNETEGQRNPLARGHFNYAGPFFLGDDHGSYHGEGKHGRGVGMVENAIYPDKKPDSSKNVVQECLKWIDQSDVLFVWLNQKDAYGTIAEIGYAKARNKIIFLVIEKKRMNESFHQDIWFIRTMADYVHYEESALKGWALFEKTFGSSYEATPFSYILNKQDKTWIHTKISEFANRLARERSVEALNQLNRDVLAKEFMRQHALQYRSFVTFLNDERLQQDIAEEIDYKIVRAYYKVTTNKEANELQSWAIEGTGLHYQFKQNYEKEKKNREEKGVFTPAQEAPATPSQLRYMRSLLQKNEYDLHIPLEMLTRSQAGSFIGHFVDGSDLNEENRALLKQQQLDEFSGTLKASALVARLKRIFENEEHMKITIPLHTKCKYYFEDLDVIKENDADGDYLVQNEYGEFEYTQKWLNLLVATLRDPNKYAVLKAYKKGTLKK